MNNTPFHRRSPDQTASIQLWRIGFNKFVILRRKPVARSRPVGIATREKNNGILGLTKPGCRLDQSIKHSLQVEGGAADDLEDIGGRRLLLERYRQVARALAQLAEQPRVFDGNDGLVGEGS